MSLIHPFTRNDYLRFLVSDEEFGVPLRRIEEIVEYGTISPVPGAAPWIRGVFNLRGRVLPVVDIARRIGLPSQPVTKRTVLVVARIEIKNERVELALIADYVKDVIPVEPDNLEQAPPFGMGMQLQYISGLLRIDDGFLKLIDLQTIFGDGLAPEAPIVRETVHTESPTQNGSSTAPTLPKPNESVARPKNVETPPLPTLGETKPASTPTNDPSSSIPTPDDVRITELAEGIFVFDDEDDKEIQEPAANSGTVRNSSIDSSTTLTEIASIDTTDDLGATEFAEGIFVFEDDVPETPLAETPEIQRACQAPLLSSDSAITENSENVEDKPETKLLLPPEVSPSSAMRSHRHLTDFETSASLLASILPMESKWIPEKRSAR